jgi:hypothetical protein
MDDRLYMSVISEAIYMAHGGFMSPARRELGLHRPQP